MKGEIDEKDKDESIQGPIRLALRGQVIHSITHNANSVTINMVEGHSVEFFIEEVASGDKPRHELHACVKVVTRYDGKATI